MSEPQIKTYKEFWPFYMSQHSDPMNRKMHYVGTIITFVFLFLAISQAEPLLLLGMPIGGYGFAWFGHFVIEKNRPATFTYPIWSLVSDYRMFFLFLAGKIK